MSIELNKSDTFKVAQGIKINPVFVVDFRLNVEHQRHNISNHPAESAKLGKQLRVSEYLSRPIAKLTVLFEYSAPNEASPARTRDHAPASHCRIRYRDFEEVDEPVVLPR